MQIIQQYIGLTVFLALLAGFPVMIIYVVVLYFRGRKIPKSPNEKKKGNEVEWQEDSYLDSINGDLSDPAYWFRRFH
ncbi:MAG: hypothetical protein K8R02_07715 [Anaerohalosphaeraceae bacterium]|nr:hypothetical protein [Anaerohalosphaeraceae bacterium]